MRKRIALVVRLFKEAGKAIEDMPLLLVQPLMTFVAIMLVLAGYVFIAVQIQGGGFLTQDPVTKDIYYKMDSIMQVRNLGALSCIIRYQSTMSQPCWAILPNQTFQGR